MKNKKTFWQQHEKLMRLIDVQSNALLVHNRESYEQSKLDILSTIEQIKISINGDTLYDIAKDIFS